MQQCLEHFEAELKETLDEIWAKPPEETHVDSWAIRMSEAERDRKTNPVNKVPKPELPPSGWKVTLFDEGMF
jgi:elongator complex protein 1